MMTDDAQLEGCCAARSSTLPASAAAGALRARVEPAGPGCLGLPRLVVTLSAGYRYLIYFGRSLKRRQNGRNHTTTRPPRPQKAGQPGGHVVRSPWASGFSHSVRASVSSQCVCHSYPQLIVGNMYRLGTG